jgi:hypothetical protein
MPQAVAAPCQDGSKRHYATPACHGWLAVATSAGWPARLVASGPARRSDRLAFDLTELVGADVLGPRQAGGRPQAEGEAFYLLLFLLL